MVADKLDIAIIGGGIAGLTLAISLMKFEHVKVTIYEAAAKFGEIGTGVAFGPNATRAMAHISPEVKQGFQNVATYNLWPSKKDIWFDFRFGQDQPDGTKAGEWFHGLHCPSGQAAVHRADFLDELVKLVPEGIAKFGKHVEALEDVDGGTKLVFSDGTEALHQAIIGCDGIKSQTRKYILGENNSVAFASYTGKYCHRGLIPMKKAVDALGEELAQNNNMYLGHHGHILTFPVRKGETMNGELEHMN